VTLAPDRRPVVLVVDDDPDIADAIADVLHSGGYHVEAAPDGSAAIERITRARVHLVLLDWRLPGEPVGSALVRRIRDLCGPIPIVVLSADPTSLQEARDAQCSDYLPKPFEIDDLLHVVDSLCPSVG
jgi:two-component system chemotaxis response regulator CheY